MSVRCLCYFMLVISSLAVSGQNRDGMLDSLIRRTSVQLYNFPQEKIHLTTDKANYMGGDTIWFRAFVVNALTHEPVNASKYIYAELKTPFDSLESRVKIIEHDGVYSGYIPLDPKIGEGDYTLIAYTMFMESVGEEYFAKKSVNITSPFATQTEIKTKFDFEDTETANPSLLVTINYCDRVSGKSKPYEGMYYTQSDGKSFNKLKGSKPINLRLKGDAMRGGYLLVAFKNYQKYIRLPKIDATENPAITFHPEGGYLIPGKACRVAFKAINTNGIGDDISGIVVDSKGTKVADFESLHAGMGAFTFVPLGDESYKAVCKNKAGKTIELPLPRINSDATVIKIGYPNKRQFSVGVQSVSGDVATQNLNIVILQRGKVLYADAYSNEITLNKDAFPAGILQVMLVDSKYNTLSERMLFIKRKQDQTTLCDIEKESYGNREKVNVSVALSGFSLPEGNYAVTVTDDKSVSIDSIYSIESNLLLDSELCGNIESPAYYFSSSDIRKDMALDALLLTQGWRRYDIPQVIKGIYTEPLYPMEIDQEISGTVKSKWKNKELANASVNIISPKVQYANIVKTDKNGRFSCNGFNYADGTKFVVQAFNTKGSSEMNVSIDDPRFPSIKNIIMPFKPNLVAETFLSHESQRLQHNNNLKMILLDEVTITAKKPKVPEDVFEALATKSYGYEELEKKGITSIEEVLRGIAGVVLRDGNIIYRGGNVAVFIDGVYLEPPTTGGSTEIFRQVNDYYSSIQELKERIPFDFIKRIDFLKPNEAVVLGSRAGAGGALMVKTKEGGELMKWQRPVEIKLVNPLGYQKPVEFYSPKYFRQGAAIDNVDYRSTLYWNPCVDVSSKGTSSFNFYTSDVKNTNYTLKIEGITYSGEVIQTSNKIKKD